MRNRLRNGPRRLPLPAAATALLLALLAGVETAAAAVFTNGSASIWAYLRDDSVEHTQIVPAFSFTVGDLGVKGLRFEGSVRGYTDVRGGKSEDRTLSILRGVLVYTPAQRPCEIRLGQQWLSEGVGRGNLAGLWWRRHFTRRTSLTLYGGSKIANRISLEETNRYEGYVFGLHARTRLEPFNVSASYYYLGRAGDVRYHAAGLEANGRVFEPLTLRGRFEMNIERAALERAQLAASVQAHRNVMVTAEYRSQAPRIYEDSYFAIFYGDARTNYGRAAVRWDFRRPFYARAGGTVLFSEYPDPLYKAQFALGHRIAEIGYTHWLSVAKGEMDGVFAQARYRLCERTELFGGYDWSRGSNADDNLRPATDSHAAFLGANADVLQCLAVNARAEQIRSLERKSDWRALLGMTMRFSNLR